MKLGIVAYITLLVWIQITFAVNIYFFSDDECLDNVLSFDSCFLVNATFQETSYSFDIVAVGPVNDTFGLGFKLYLDATCSSYIFSFESHQEQCEILPNWTNLYLLEPYNSEVMGYLAS